MLQDWRWTKQNQDRLHIWKDERGKKIQLTSLEEDSLLSVSAICRRVREEMDLSEELSDEQVYAWIDTVILQRTEGVPMDLQKKTELRKQVFHSLRRLDVLQELVEDESISEIMVNGYDCIFVEREGEVIKTDKRFESKERYEDVVQQIVSKANRVVNRTNPIVDARLDNGSRVNVILEPVALDGTTMTIRKFRDRVWHMEKLVELGTLNQRMVELFQLFVEARYNIIVSGGTGSGKTTLLNLLSEFIPERERIITIEDSAELHLKGIPNLVRLETRDNNVEGEHGIAIKDLIRASMRLRPDRLIVGEVRGEEAFYMINAAMNTGHDGSLSTCHANSCRDAISRLETMVLMECEMPLGAIRRQIGSAVDILIQVGRLRDRSRKVLEVAEVLGVEGTEVILHPLLKFQEEGEAEGRIYGSWVFCGTLQNREKLYLSGLERRYRELEEMEREGENLHAGV